MSTLPDRPRIHDATIQDVTIQDVTPDWTQRQASHLADTLADLREATRAAEHAHGCRVTISVHQARVLLRALDPVGHRHGGRRSHALRVLSAVGDWWREHVRATLSAGHPRLLEPAIATTLAVRTACDTWANVLRWHQACVRAGTNWPIPINAITAQSPGRRVPHPFRLPSPAGRVTPGQGVLLLPLPGASPGRAQQERP